MSLFWTIVAALLFVVAVVAFIRHLANSADGWRHLLEGIAVAVIFAGMGFLLFWRPH